MTDDEQTERRLRAMLAHRADQVDSRLSGPDLRWRADGHEHPAGRVRRLAPVLAAAAAVAVIATVVAVVETADPKQGPAPIPPGRQPTTAQPITTSPITSSPIITSPITSSPSTSSAPTARPTEPPLPSLGAPTVSGRPTITSTATPSMTPSVSPSATPTSTSSPSGR